MAVVTGRETAVRERDIVHGGMFLLTQDTEFAGERQEGDGKKAIPLVAN
jgi:hypothetical protein